MQRLRRFEATSLEDALAQVRREVGDDARIISAEKVRRGGVGGFFAKETFEIAVEEDDVADPVDGPRSLMDLVDEVEDPEPEFVPSVMAPPTPPRVSTEGPAFAAVLERISAESAPSPRLSTGPVPVESHGELVALGLPDAYLPEAGAARAHDLRQALAVSLARLPQPPALPQWTGSVVAVIGPRDEALALGRDLAAQLGHDPAELALVAQSYKGKQVPKWLQITTPDEADEHRRSWRRRTTPTVVVVDAPVGCRHAAWASDVLDKLEPALAWGIVEATRKTADIAAWNRAVGGVDVLSVKRVDETVAPADILRLGIPVGRLDDEPATAERWAGVLWERLAA